MILSFAARLVCVAVVITGLIHIALELLLWLTAPFVLRRSEALPARLRERLLYILQLVPILAGVTLGWAVGIPRYIGSESNHDAESVGWMCVAGAIGFGIWYCSALLRGLAVAGRTLLFARRCRKVSTPVSFARASTPVLSYPGKAYSVALVGLFRPFILISDGLLGEGGFSASAMEVVLEHETSHATHRDNWKLFSLCCVPRLGLRLGNGRTWTDLWRAAAEWAADDDAVRGDRARVLVLAETLLSVARHGAQPARRVCMALECDQQDLVARVGRLLDRPKQTALPESRGAICAVMVGAVAFVGATVGLLLSSHELLERMLHLGQG